MDFRFTAEQEAFRQEIRAFVREALPEPPDIPEDAWIIGFDRAFSKISGPWLDWLDLAACVWRPGKELSGSPHSHGGVVAAWRSRSSTLVGGPPDGAGHPALWHPRAKVKIFTGDYLRRQRVLYWHERSLALAPTSPVCRPKQWTTGMRTSSADKRSGPVLHIWPTTVIWWRAPTRTCPNIRASANFWSTCGRRESPSSPLWI